MTSLQHSFQPKSETRQSQLTWKLQNLQGKNQSNQNDTKYNQIQKIPKNWKKSKELKSKELIAC